MYSFKLIAAITAIWRKITTTVLLLERLFQVQVPQEIANVLKFTFRILLKTCFINPFKYIPFFHNIFHRKLKLQWKFLNWLHEILSNSSIDLRQAVIPMLGLAYLKFKPKTCLKFNLLPSSFSSLKKTVLTNNSILSFNKITIF